MGIEAQSFMSGGGVRIPNFSDSNVSSITERLSREKLLRDRMELQQQNAMMQQVKFQDYITETARMKKINEVTDVNTIKTAEMQQNNMNVADDFTKIVSNTNTETADAVNDSYKILAEKAKNGNWSQERLDKATVTMNEMYGKMQDSGDLGMHDVTNNAQFGSRVAEKLRGRDVTPAMSQLYTGGYTRAATANDAAEAARIKLQGNNIEKTTAIAEAANKELGSIGAPVDYTALPEYKELDNPWMADVFGAWEKDKFGTISGGDDSRIGKKEIGQALLELGQAEFPTEVTKDAEGNTTGVVATTKLTDKQIEEVLRNSFVEGGGFGALADHYDANKIANNAKFIAMRDKDKATKVSGKDLAKARTEAVKEATKVENKGERRLADLTGLQTRAEYRKQREAEALAEQLAKEQEQKAKALLKP